MAIILHIEDVIAGNTFGERLRNARAISGLTAQKVAERINVSYPAYISYESKGKQPRQETLVKISNTLNVSIDQLLGTSDTRNGFLENGRVISIPSGGSGDNFYEDDFVDISPILSALVYATQRRYAKYYDDLTQKELPLDEDTSFMVSEYVNKIRDKLHEWLIENSKKHTADSEHKDET